jgi:chloramphenicol-sensitive protein RarD
MERSSARGVLEAAGAYLMWGIFPVYWKQLRAVPAGDLLAHRVVWSFLFVAALLTATRSWAPVLRASRDPRARRAMAASTVLISANWGLFIWAVNSGHILAASLGYYMNPLLNVLLGRMVLGERLRPAQLAAVALAAAGVLNLAVSLHALPWISLTLAATFALYGLVRKTAPVDSLTGLSIETALLAGPALAFLLVQQQGALLPSLEGWRQALLLGSGAATAIPLLLFADAARRLRYSTLGLVQYVAPTCQLLVAVLIYGEPFTRAHAVTFACIWTAVGLYAWDALRPAPAQVAAG